MRSQLLESRQRILAEDLAKDRIGDGPEIPYTEAELIERAIRIAKLKTYPRWVAVKGVFGTGRTVSEAICKKYGFDPDEEL